MWLSGASLWLVAQQGLGAGGRGERGAESSLSPPQGAVVRLLLMGFVWFYCHSTRESLSSAQTQEFLMYLILSISKCFSHVTG